MTMMMMMTIMIWRWYILSMPLEAGQWISAEIYGLDDVFPPNAFGSSVYTQFIIIYIP